jgi:hypothetical protein
MRALAACLLLFATIRPEPLFAQTVVTEIDVSAGHSTEDVDAAGTQVRVYGEAGAGWRFNAEGTWANVWGRQSDVFGAAYPYNDRLRPMEVFAENTHYFGPYLAGVRLGRYRTPFGIYNRSDHGYNGFLRAPLIRYGGYWALSNTFLEHGASVMAGLPRAFVEASVGVPHDEGGYPRRKALDETVRFQGAAGAWVIGASYIRTPRAERFRLASGNAEFGGIDVRWMQDGVQIRGEWIEGRPFVGAHTSGGYVDAFIHRPRMGPVTGILRAERLDYDAGRFSSHPRRYTAGARVRISSALVGSVNLVQQPTDVRLPRVSSVDVGLTFSIRR